MVTSMSRLARRWWNIVGSALLTQDLVVPFLAAMLCARSRWFIILSSTPQLPVYCAVFGGRLFRSGFLCCGRSCRLGGVGWR